MFGKILTFKKSFIKNPGKNLSDTFSTILIFDHKTEIKIDKVVKRRKNNVLCER